MNGTLLQEINWYLSFLLSLLPSSSVFFLIKTLTKVPPKSMATRVDISEPLLLLHFSDLMPSLAELLASNATVTSASSAETAHYIYCTKCQRAFLHSHFNVQTVHTCLAPSKLFGGRQVLND